MRSLAQWRVFLTLSVLLIAAGMVRSAWSTRRDGFTIDEPWHITAGVAYLRTGEYYLNPEHPPLVKLVAGLAAPRSVFRLTEPDKLLDKNTERIFVQSTIYEQNNADLVQARVRRTMYGLLLLCFALTAFRVVGSAAALGALVFTLIDPTVAAHWPVVMTDLPVALLSVISVLLCVLLLREWSPINLSLFAIALGLTLSAKHSGVITFGFVAALGMGAVLWKWRREWRVALRRLAAFLSVLFCAIAILWGMYRFHYYESTSRQEKFNRSLTAKIEDVQSSGWRFALEKLAQWHVFPRSYVWGLADIVRTGMEGRAYSTYAFGRLTFMVRRPLIFPGYIAVKLPIVLTLLSLFGCAVIFRWNTPDADKHVALVLLALAAVLLIILARSRADYAGVRHALTVYFVMAIFGGFGVRYLMSQGKVFQVAAAGVILGACLPALAVERPWEYHNILGGGTKGAYRYFRNDGIDVGQRDKEIADCCRTKLEPAGEVPWVSYTPSFVKPDLIHYRHAKLKGIDDPLGDDLPPATISGTLLVHGSDTAPAIWSDNRALREAQPVDRIGIVLVYRGTYYLPNARAGALFDRASTLFDGSKPDLEKIESLLKEGLALRSNDFTGWMMLGNLHLIRGERHQALAAYEKARDSTPPSAFRKLFEEQVQKVATEPAGTVKPMRNPSME
jgi:hypothetical protein